MIWENFDLFTSEALCRLFFHFDVVRYELIWMFSFNTAMNPTDGAVDHSYGKQDEH